jgi:hypothetical protein
MTASVERIKQDIALLDQAVVTLAEAFQTAYASYLNTLGQAVRQQLVLAAYQVCTQGYPQQFLELSVSQRQGLQQSLRDLAKQAQTSLLEQGHPFHPEAAELFKGLEQPNLTQDSDATELVPLSTGEDDLVARSIAEQLALQQKVLRTPARLRQWQGVTELKVDKKLAIVSHQTNRLLQEFDILPSQLPDALLQHASKAEFADGLPRSPNLLNVLVEAAEDADATQDEEDAKAPEILQVLAIHLRLVEIEFADGATMAARSKIRELTARLKKLDYDYRKKQREYAIASAQEAWRSSWFED